MLCYVKLTQKFGWTAFDTREDAVRLCAIRNSWQFKTRIFYLYKICKQYKWTYSSNLYSSFNIRVNWYQFARDFFDEKDANHHESRI